MIRNLKRLNDKLLRCKITLTTTTMMMMCSGSNPDTDCGTDDDLASSSGEVASCVHSMYGCCPDGVTARLTDDDDACLTSTIASNTLPTSDHPSTSDHVTIPSQKTTAVVSPSSILSSTSYHVTSPSQTTTVGRVTSSFQTTTTVMSTTAVETTTLGVLSSSNHDSWNDEGDGPVTSLGTDREPAYSTTSSPSDDVTTVITAQPTPDVDIIRRGEYWNILQGRH